MKQARLQEIGIPAAWCLIFDITSAPSPNVIVHDGQAVAAVAHDALRGSVAARSERNSGRVFFMSELFVFLKHLV